MIDHAYKYRFPYLEVLGIFQVMDAGFTTWAMGMGIAEMNPFVNSLLDTTGAETPMAIFLTLAVFKLVPVAFLLFLAGQDISHFGPTHKWWRKLCFALAMIAVFLYAPIILLHLFMFFGDLS